jgi:hypothetical protein
MTPELTTPADIADLVASLAAARKAVWAVDREADKARKAWERLEEARVRAYSEAARLRADLDRLLDPPLAAGCDTA